MTAEMACGLGVGVLVGVRLAGEWGLERLNQSEVRRNAGAIPGPFRGVMDDASYQRSVAYTLAKSRFSQLQALQDGVWLGVVLLSGALPWLLEAFTSWRGASPWALSFFLVLVGVAWGLPGLPLDWYRQFRLEARFGFNTATLGTWWLDRVKEWGLSLLLGWPLLALVLALVDWTGPSWWLWAWGAILGFQFVMMFLGPAVILPLFNTFTPLGEGPLRERLVALAQRTGFRARSIQIMDGSRRSRHANAFFAGFGRFRKIVLFDTLLEQLTEPELEAVLAHEIGHYRLRHIPKMFFGTALGLLFGLGTVAWLAGRTWFLPTFGFAPGNLAAAFLLFALLGGTITFWALPAFNALSRRFEYEADAFAAAAMGDPDALVGALRKLTGKNLGNLTPHPTYIRFHYSHPTLLERERALQAQRSGAVSAHDSTSGSPPGGTADGKEAKPAGPAFGCGFLAVVLLAGAIPAASARAADAGDPLGAVPFESLPQARYTFGGGVGERVQANLDQWLLTAPQANPGLLEMFALRDREPRPNLVPWAGEFVGKYLISALQALHMTSDQRLRDQVKAVVSGLIASQADDGYLGPFPKDERLLKYWDLWGHYHAIEALLRWHEASGDPAALTAARRAGDRVCQTYLGTGRRVYDAGDHEMNMAILTGLARLYRATGEGRYLQMAREVEQDWERAGDYLRAGLDGREFFEGPRPRWESLHDLQGLLELWRITGDARYRQAFTHHWRSLRRWDMRNTGGFSSGEQATGNPYAPTPIETCCTVAWMALTVDYLRLTGDPQAADVLEWATFNGGLGAQHPSGRWWTYNTPMDGVREASAHTIVFQARAGTPELNCCSVNAPRVLGVASEWAVMRDASGPVVNWLGPFTAEFSLPPSNRIRLICETEYPLTDELALRVRAERPQAFTLRLRMPAFAREPRASLNGVDLPPVRPGRYLQLDRTWGTNADDVVRLRLGMGIRAVPGAMEAAGRASLYRGPLLLAYDQRANPFDEQAIPPVALDRLDQARVVSPTPSRRSSPAIGEPWLTVEVPTDDGRPLRLVDFASAGSSGTRYRSWLPTSPTLPPPAMTRRPRDGATLPPGAVRFRWRGPSRPEAFLESYRLEFAADPEFVSAVVRVGPVVGNSITLAADRVPLLEQPGPVYWRVVSVAHGRETTPDVPPAHFVIHPQAPQPEVEPELVLGPQGELIVHSLRDDRPPEWGRLTSPDSPRGGPGGTTLDGQSQRLVYAVPVWPTEAFTAAVRVRVRELPKGRLGQVLSAWATGMDDPLRLVVDGGKLCARVEAGGGYSTPGFSLETGREYAVVAVKDEGNLRCWVDGREIGACPVPADRVTRARDLALGGNPHYEGNEFLAATFADFRFYGRAWTPAEVAEWSR